MAEFKDISLFEEVTPTYANAVNMWVQVSATEKVNLAAVAAMAKDAPIADAGGSPPPQVAGNWYFPGLKTASPYDTIFEAISKLAGISANSKLGIYALHNHGIGSVNGYAIIYEVSTYSAYEILYLTTEFIALVMVDSTTFEASNPTEILSKGSNYIYGTTEDGFSTKLVNFLAPKFIPSPTIGSLSGNQIAYCYSAVNGGTITIKEFGCMEDTNHINQISSIVVFSSITNPPTFKLDSSLSGYTLYKCEGFDDVVKAGATNVVVTAQLVKTNSNTYAIYLNAAKYEAVS